MSRKYPVSIPRSTGLPFSRNLYSAVALQIAPAKARIRIEVLVGFSLRNGIQLNLGVNIDNYTIDPCREGINFHINIRIKERESNEN